MNILKNKPIMTIYKYSVKSITFFNKYFYIITIFTFLMSLKTSLNESKFYKIIITILKIVFYINILFGFSLIIYFTDFVNPFNNTLSFYYDQIQPYLDLIQQFYNELINII